MSSSSSSKTKVCKKCNKLTDITNFYDGKGTCKKCYNIKKEKSETNNNVKRIKSYMLISEEDYNGLQSKIQELTEKHKTVVDRLEYVEGYSRGFAEERIKFQEKKNEAIYCDLKQHLDKYYQDKRDIMNNIFDHIKAQYDQERIDRISELNKSYQKGLTEILERIESKIDACIQKKIDDKFALLFNSFLNKNTP